MTLAGVDAPRREHVLGDAHPAVAVGSREAVNASVNRLRAQGCPILSEPRARP
jgi:hypothetical protein